MSSSSSRVQKNKEICKARDTVTAKTVKRLPNEFDVLKNYISQKNAEELSNRLKRMSLFFESFKDSFDVKPPKFKNAKPISPKMAVKTDVEFDEEEYGESDDEISSDNDEKECSGYSSPDDNDEEEGENEDDESFLATQDKKRLKDSGLEELANEIYGNSYSEDDETDDSMLVDS